MRSIRTNRSTWIDQRNAKWVFAWTRVPAFFGVRRANDNITRQATAWWQSRRDSSRPHGPSARPSNFTNTDSRVNTIKAAATPASGLMSNPSHWRNAFPSFFFLLSMNYLQMKNFLSKIDNFYRIFWSNWLILYNGYNISIYLKGGKLDPIDPVLLMEHI